MDMVHAMGVICGFEKLCSNDMGTSAKHALVACLFICLLSFDRLRLQSLVSNVKRMHVPCNTSLIVIFIKCCKQSYFLIDFVYYLYCGN